MVGHELRGFVLVTKGSELAADMQAMDVAEFFELRGQRRKGIGRQAFRQLVNMFPGPWVVRVQDGVPSALGFWDQVISEAADGRVSREVIGDGERDRIVFRFSAN